MEDMNECNICGKSFRYNYLLVRHKNGKLSCNKSKKIIDNYNNKIIDIDNKLNNLYELSMESKTKCYYCENDYNNKSNLRRHIRSYCEERQKLLDDKNKCTEIINNKKKEEEININVNKEILEYKKIIADLQKKINNFENNTHNIKNIDNSKNNKNIDNSKNINIIVNNNVDLNSFGYEDLSHISDKEYEKYLSKFFPGLIDYIEKVHFSDEKPSNHNICIPKINSKYVAIFEKNKWNLKDKNYLLDKLISKKLMSLNNKCDELEENNLIKDNIVELHNEFNNNYYNGDEDIKKNLENDIALLIFNNRNKIKDYDKLLQHGLF